METTTKCPYERNSMKALNWEYNSLPMKDQYKVGVILALVSTLAIGFAFVVMFWL